MKIWLPATDHIGGHRRFCEYLADGLARTGHQTRVDLFPIPVQYKPWILRRLEAPKDTDIVLANCWSAFALARPPARLVVYDQLPVYDPACRQDTSFLQMVFRKTVLRRYVRTSLNVADVVVAVSHCVADKLKQGFGDHPVEIIYNGIDTDFFRPAPQGKTPLDGRPVRLLFAGDLIRRKGADLLQPILSALGPGFELLCVSGGRANVEIPKDPAIRHREGLTPREMCEAYRWADLLLFPSRLEGFGLVAAEAFACGTPVITTTASALPEVVDQSCGRLCPPNNVAAFAAAIRESVADAAGLTAMGERGRERAQRYFDSSSMVSRYVTLFERLLR